MRKSVFLGLILLLGGAIGLRAQSLQNTNWKLYIDELHDTITLHVAKDSSFVTVGGNVVVRSSFKTSKDTITMKDVDGQYACPGDEGVYKYTVENGILTFFLIGDPCENRKNSISGAKWTKQ